MRQKQISFLFKKSETLINTIEEKYLKNIKNKNLEDDEFRIEILFYLVCLRVISDYLMKDIIDYYGITWIPRDNFPIYGFKKLSEKDNITAKEEFSRRPLLISIKEKNEGLYNYIIDIQWFNWEAKLRIAHFLDLVNHNKHDQLSPNIIKENESINYNWIRFWWIIMCNTWRLLDNWKDIIKPNTNVTPKNIEELKSTGDISPDFRKEIRDSIHFSWIQENIIDFLKKTSREISKITEDIYGFLK